MSILKTNQLQDTSGNGYLFGSFRNKLINGDMCIDQRNKGTAKTINGATSYTLDRWESTDDTDGDFTIQRVEDAPPNGRYALKVTVGTADASLAASQEAFVVQKIEGRNCVDLAFGSATAKAISLSFWVKSSMTGTFGGAIVNSAENRSYPFSYSISSANTYELVEVNIAGDTTGTWLFDNNIGMRVIFSLGAGSTYLGSANAWAAALYLAPTGSTSLIGTASATWQIANVQLERGLKATEFEQLPPDVTAQRCKRYYQRFSGTSDAAGARCGGVTGSTSNGFYQLTVPLRGAPTDAESGLEIKNASDSTATITNIRANQFFDRQDEYATLRFDGSSLGPGGNTMRLPDAADFLELDAEI